MRDVVAQNEAARRLRAILQRAEADDSLTSIVASRGQVLARYQPMFSPSHLAELTADEFRSFLDFKNNQHWTGLHRQGPRICADMDRLRRGLALLFDDNQDLTSRLDQAITLVDGMGKAIATAVLHVVHPDRYSVWNRISEEALQTHGLWPTLEPHMSFGERYKCVNAVLNDLAAEVGVDLWTLDGLLWRANEPVPSEVGAVTDPALPPVADVEFGLERHLHEFLLDNWELTDLGKEWAIYGTEEDPEAGYEYTCDVGRIDILARHRHEPRWLVVELKRAHAGDQALGQILRYMGWVRKHKADGDTVEGVIIAREGELSLSYALEIVPDVKLMRYTVRFELLDAEDLADGDDLGVA